MESKRGGEMAKKDQIPIKMDVTITGTYACENK